MSRPMPVAPPPPPTLAQYLEDTSHPSASTSHSVHVAAFAGSTDALPATAAASATAGAAAAADSNNIGEHDGKATKVASVASVADLTLQSACRCPHLDAVLPHILRMDRYDPIVELHLGQHFGDVTPLTAGGKLVGSASASARTGTTAAAAAAANVAATSPIGSPRDGHHAHHHHHHHRHSSPKSTGPPAPAAHATATGSVGPSSPMPPAPAPTSSGRSSSNQRADRSVFGLEHARLLSVSGRGGAATTWCPVLPPLYQPSGSTGSKYSSANSKSNGGSSGASSMGKGDKKRKVAPAAPATTKAHSVQLAKDDAATKVPALTADDAKSNVLPAAAKAETASAPTTAHDIASTVVSTTPLASTTNPVVPILSATDVVSKEINDGMDDKGGRPSAVPPAKSEGNEKVIAQTASAKGENPLDVPGSIPIGTKEGEKEGEPENEGGNAKAVVANERGGGDPINPGNNNSPAGATAAKDSDSAEKTKNDVGNAPDAKDKPEQGDANLNVMNGDDAPECKTQEADADDIVSNAHPAGATSSTANVGEASSAAPMEVDNPLGKTSSDIKMSSGSIEELTSNKAEEEKNEASLPSEMTQTTQSHQLSDSRYNQLRSRERRIMRERENVMLKSRTLPPEEDVRLAQQKQSHRPMKRKKGEAAAADGSMGSAHDDIHSSHERRMLRLRASVASSKVEEWLQVVRDGREAFYNEHESNRYQRRCAWCPPSMSTNKRDGLMQCLECSVVGCGPSSTSSDSSAHMMCHFIASGHNFGITCGPRAEIFCMKCGDFVYHEVFDQEKERMDISHYLPQFGWEVGSLRRSYEPFSFVSTPDHDIVWRGMMASYPTSVPTEFVLAGRLALRRQLVFNGEMEAGGDCSTWGPMASRLAITQSRLGKKRCRIKAPVGMYNLGNTCFMSSVLQCLVNCPPIQRYFLRDGKHNHLSCQVLRSSCGEAPTSPTKSNHNSDSHGICIACEMDRLMLEYYGSTIGHNGITDAVGEAPNPSACLVTSTANPAVPSQDKCGDPLVPSGLLAATWKSGGMKHLAGYQQRDSHEFLSAFLDIMSKHDRHFADITKELREEAKPSSLISKESARERSPNDISEDIVKSLFAGNLRSVLICETCGYKRSQPEPFLNISLPITSETKTIEACLRHFTQPEDLSDITCDLCEEKHPHTKQHTFAKLPKILCLHLKRFDAATNKKISEFVSFPAQLNVGPFLPHWCEVIQGMKASEHAAEPDGDNNAQKAKACSSAIMYDLHATINHTGTLHQGHYVANVRVDRKWYHCNDAHVFDAGEGDGEKAVLEAAVGEAYMLFYIRRDVQK